MASLSEEQLHSAADVCRFDCFEVADAVDISKSHSLTHAHTGSFAVTALLSTASRPHGGFPISTQPQLVQRRFFLPNLNNPASAARRHCLQQRTRSLPDFRFHICHSLLQLVCPIRSQALQTLNKQPRLQIWPILARIPPSRSDRHHRNHV